MNSWQTDIIHLNSSNSCYQNKSRVRNNNVSHNHKNCYSGLVRAEIGFEVGGEWADQFTCQSITAFFIHLLPLSLLSIPTPLCVSKCSTFPRTFQQPFTCKNTKTAMTGHHWGYGEANGKWRDSQVQISYLVVCFVFIHLFNYLVSSIL